MTRTEQFECVRCDRKFLSEEALSRHYDQNPKHREPVTIDAQTLVEKGKRVRDSEWVELDDRVETFLKATGSVDEREIEMQYYPAEGTVVFDGPHGETKTIDVDEMQDAASESIQWSFDGEFQKLAFLKPEHPRID